MSAADVHRSCRQGHRRVRRPDQGSRQRRSRRTTSRRAGRLRLPAADRRRLHRSVRARTAGPEAVSHDRHPLQQCSDRVEDGGDGARRGAHPRRADRPSCVGHRRRSSTPAVPASAVVVGWRVGRRRHRRSGVVALRRRQYLRRRLYPHHGAGVGERRLYGQLLPLVRHPGGALRLVLRPAGPVGARLDHEYLDAAADAGHGAGLLVADQPGGHPPTRSRGQNQPSGRLDRRGDVPGLLAAAEQWSAPRTHHCPGHPGDLVLGGTRGCHQSSAAGGGRLHHWSADSVLRTHRDRIDRRAAGGDRTVAHDPAPPRTVVRAHTAAGTHSGSGHSSDHLDIP